MDKEKQTGTIQRIINESAGIKTAIIVGDGVAYEIAELVASKVKGLFKVTKNSIIADVPSETENNMSHIYIDNGSIESVQSKREKYLLTQNPGIAIDFVRLSKINKETRPGQFLICPYKDIDDIGEKLQQKALKYYSEAIDFFAEKITLLLSCGYSKVYLISDHGFVLTGLLSEADKISVSPKGIFDKAERYIRTVNKQSDITSGLIEVEKKYKQFGYLYFAKNINPFKTPGLYGFSHGGASPQELITPYFCWEHSLEQTSSLSVEIENKEDLRNVTGELFTIKIQADKNSGDLFSAKRKINLVFFSNKLQIVCNFFSVDDFDTIIVSISFCNKAIFII